MNGEYPTYPTQEPQALAGGFEERDTGIAGTINTGRATVYDKLQNKKTILEQELGRVNQALAMLDANPHFANVMATVERALGKM